MQADVCLILEGTYPYISGGVSNWAHSLVLAQKHLSFHLLCILPPNAKLNYRFELPKNVVGVTNLFLQNLPKESFSFSRQESEKLFKSLEVPLLNLQHKATLQRLKYILETLKGSQKIPGRSVLLDSEGAWNMLIRMYLSTMGESSFLNYFWSWRGLLASFYSILLAKIPAAQVYHTLCTGYAGLFTARAYLETNKPCLLTEHGIYANERRIEITSANWLDDQKAFNLNIESKHFDRDLKDYWIDTFLGYSQMCYQACESLITLYEGNKDLQVADGADPKKIRIIPNGIDFELYSKVQRKPSSVPTVALIGRVVPIKDVKTFIRAIAILKEKIPAVQALILGPTDEDEDYFAECQDLVNQNQLDQTIVFTGKVSISKYLENIEVVVLTSISEGQPLVVLEAGAAGIPSVTTDVGACSEIISGRSDENPPLGKGGCVSYLANPVSTAESLYRLLSDREFYQQCSQTIQKRVYKYYNETDLNQAYAAIYQSLTEKERANK